MKEADKIWNAHVCVHQFQCNNALQMRQAKLDEMQNRSGGYTILEDNSCEQIWTIFVILIEDESWMMFGGRHCTNIALYYQNENPHVSHDRWLYIGSDERSNKCIRNNLLLILDIKPKIQSAHVDEQLARLSLSICQRLDNLQELQESLDKLIKLPVIF